MNFLDTLVQNNLTRLNTGVLGSSNSKELLLQSMRGQLPPAAGPTAQSHPRSSEAMNGDDPLSQLAAAAAVKQDQEGAAEAEEKQQQIAKQLLANHIVDQVLASEEGQSLVTKVVGEMLNKANSERTGAGKDNRDSKAAAKSTPSRSSRKQAVAAAEAGDPSGHVSDDSSPSPEGKSKINRRVMQDFANEEEGDGDDTTAEEQPEVEFVKTRPVETQQQQPGVIDEAQIRDYDVLMSSIKGNLPFRQLLSQYCEQYEAFASDRQKSWVVKMILSAVFQNHGRFLKPAFGFSPNGGAKFLEVKDQEEVLEYIRLMLEDQAHRNNSESGGASGGNGTQNTTSEEPTEGHEPLKKRQRKSYPPEGPSTVSPPLHPMTNHYHHPPHPHHHYHYGAPYGPPPPPPPHPYHPSEGHSHQPSVQQHLGNENTVPKDGAITSANSKAKGPWTDEEDKILEDAVAEFGGKNWKMVAQRLNGRTDIQCLHRWQKALKPGIVKGNWSAEEDKTLCDLVDQWGDKKWSFIASKLNTGRLGKQCRERYYNQLNPNIKKGPWTEEEEATLMKAHAELGNKWALIGKRLPGRAHNAIKNKWNSYLKTLKTRKRKMEKKMELEQMKQLVVMTGQAVEAQEQRAAAAVEEGE